MTQCLGCDADNIGRSKYCSTQCQNRTNHKKERELLKSAMKDLRKSKYKKKKVEALQNYSDWLDYTS